MAQPTTHVEGRPRGSAAGQDIVLSTEGLTKEFKGFRAVNGVTLEVQRGTIHALIGPNGATSNGFNENLALFASGRC
ncbi:hypothetical protein ACQKLZ_14905, partial [Methylobacterium tarhaniae]